MKKGYRTALIIGLGVIAVLGFGLWLVLESSLFSKYRISLVERLLTEDLGYEVRIDGDVGVTFYPEVILFVKEATLPGQDSPPTDLAVLKEAELSLSLKDVLQGEFEILSLFVEDLTMTFVKNEDETVNWQGVKPPPSSGAANPVGPLPFLLNRTVDFKNIRLTASDKISGFEFLFVLDDLNVKQEKGSVTVSSQGSVNGEPYASEGKFIRLGAFTVNGTFGDSSFAYNGTTSAKNFARFSGELVSDVKDLGGFLETIGLTRAFEGTANLRGTLANDGSGVALKGLELKTAFEDGRIILATGDINDLVRMTEMEVLIDANLTPTGADTSPAKSLKDLQIQSIFARILSEDKQISLDETRIVTNFGHKDFREIGPITVGQLKRRPDGRLSVEDLTLELGDGATPVLKAKGHIQDLLTFSDYDVTGEIALFASEVFPFIAEESGAKFGMAKGDFEVTDAGGHPSLTRFSLNTQGTDLWALNMQSTIGDIGSLSQARLEFDLGVPDGGAFLTALGLKTIALKDVKMSGVLEKTDKTTMLTYAVGAGKTQIDANLLGQVEDGRPKLTGAISSPQVRTQDLKDVVAAGLAIKTLTAPPVPDYKPLVLPPPPALEYQPLVLDPANDKVEISELLDLEGLVQKADVSVAISIDKLLGQDGVSGLKSDLSVQEGKMRFGPVQASLGGGRFSFGANMDLLNTPEILGISGSTSGWDFGEILSSVGVDIPASGTINAKFNLAGRRDSIDAFLASMGGSATVYMSNGRIGTSLLEMAGIGVVKWLFSQELQAGQTQITCASAPLALRGGTITIKEAVIDTRQTQIVVKGSVDLRKDTIALRAAPRPIGKPLARSPWPFSVSGSLSKPVVKKVNEGARTARVPLKMPAERKPCVNDLSQLIKVTP